MSEDALEWTEEQIAAYKLASNHQETMTFYLHEACPKCGKQTPFVYITQGRCPKCLVAEIDANREALTEEFERLRVSGSHAELYRRAAVVLFGVLLGKVDARYADHAWLYDLVHDGRGLIDADAEVIDLICTTGQDKV